MYSSRTFKFARGTRATTEADIKKQFKLTPAEAGLSSDKLWELAVKKVARGEPTEAFRDPLSAVQIAQLKTANSFTSDKLINFDRQSLRQLILRRRDCLVVSRSPMRPLNSSVRVRQSEHTAWRLDRVPARGEHRRLGSGVLGDRGRHVGLPNAFVSRLASKPRMGCEVIRFEQDEARGRVTAVYRTEDREYSEEADFLLCTIPLPILARVEVNPPFSHEKQRAILEVGYDSGTKVALKTKNRFWEKHNGIYGGASTTDLTTGAIVYPSDNALG